MTLGTRRKVQASGTLHQERLTRTVTYGDTMGKPHENELVASKFNSHPTPSYGKHSLESVENVALKILDAIFAVKSPGTLYRRLYSSQAYEQWCIDTFAEH